MQTPNNQLIKYMSSLKSTEFIFIATPGKIGDALLAHAAYALFDRLGLAYRCGNTHEHYQHKILVIGGGGNLVGHLYSELENFISNNIQCNKIIILPHTIHQLPKIESWLNTANLTVFCRESITFNYLNRLTKKQANIYLAEDLASTLTPYEFAPYQKFAAHGIANAFRYDAESAGLILPADNFDVSATWNGDFWHNKILCHHAVHSMASYLASFRQINTDRLHTAILAGILGKKVNLYPGSYHKIKSVYQQTIQQRWSKIKLITSNRLVA